MTNVASELEGNYRLSQHSWSFPSWLPHAAAGTRDNNDPMTPSYT